MYDVVSWWVELPVGWGYWWGIPLVYKCCKMVGDTSCGWGRWMGGSL